MNRKNFEQAVWESDLNPYARLVCLTFAGAADYKNKDQEVWLSKAKVSTRAGLHPDTVKKYVDALVKDGWLVPSKEYGRAQGFFLGAGQVTEKQLLDRPRASNLSPNHQEIESPNGQDIDTPQVVSESPNHQETDVAETEDLSPNGAVESPNGAVSLSPNGAGGISYPLGTNNHEEPYLEEPKKNQREDSQAHPPFDENKEGWEDMRYPLEERIEMYLFEKYGPGTGLNKDEVDRVHTLTSTAAWGGRDFVTAVEMVYADKQKGWDEW